MVFAYSILLTCAYTYDKSDCKADWDLFQLIAVLHRERVSLGCLSFLMANGKSNSWNYCTLFTSRGLGIKLYPIGRDYVWFSISFRNNTCLKRLCKVYRNKRIVGFLLPLVVCSIKFWCAHKHHNPFKNYVLHSPVIEEMVLCIVDVWIFLSKVLHPPSFSICLEWAKKLLCLGRCIWLSANVARKVYSKQQIGNQKLLCIDSTFWPWQKTNQYAVYWVSFQSICVWIRR